MFRGWLAGHMGGKHGKQSKMPQPVKKIWYALFSPYSRKKKKTAFKKFFVKNKTWLKHIKTTSSLDISPIILRFINFHRFTDASCRIAIGACIGLRLEVVPQIKISHYQKTPSVVCLPLRFGRHLRWDTAATQLAGISELCGSAPTTRVSAAPPGICMKVRHWLTAFQEAREEQGQNQDQYAFKNKMALPHFSLPFA